MKSVSVLSKSAWIELASGHTLEQPVVLGVVQGCCCAPPSHPSRHAPYRKCCKNFLHQLRALKQGCVRVRSKVVRKAIARVLTVISQTQRSALREAFKNKVCSSVKFHLLSTGYSASPRDRRAVSRSVSPET